LIFLSTFYTLKTDWFIFIASVALGLATGFAMVILIYLIVRFSTRIKFKEPSKGVRGITRIAVLVCYDDDRRTTCK